MIVATIILAVLPGAFLPSTCRLGSSKPEPDEERREFEAPPGPTIPAPADLPEKRWIEHTVIPAESVDDIARRYAVPSRFVGRWNGIGEGEELSPGTVLRIHAAQVPLAQQRVIYRPERGESWSSVAERFEVPVTKLEAYNPELVGRAFAPGTQLVVYIDPKPPRRVEAAQIPEFTVRPNAISVGEPQAGRLVEAVQLPANDRLYKRRSPQIMWCSSYTAENLLRAIAAFRYTHHYEGEIVVADISKKKGGRYGKHRSHQSGRDVDIWLPTLAGVYQPSQLRPGRVRRPEPEEADWFALYGLLRAFADTGAVEAVFLDESLHGRVYEAGKLMGASEEELAETVAYPPGKVRGKPLLRHSANHTHHVHVRFACGPLDRCEESASDEPGD